MEQDETETHKDGCKDDQLGEGEAGAQSVFGVKMSRKLIGSKHPHDETHATKKAEAGIHVTGLAPGQLETMVKR